MKMVHQADKDPEGMSRVHGEQIKFARRMLIKKYGASWKAKAGIKD